MSQPVNAAPARESPQQEDLSGPPAANRHRLPDERVGLTHHFSIAGHEGYLTVGLYPNGQPGEIFHPDGKGGLDDRGIDGVFRHCRLGEPAAWSAAQGALRQALAYSVRALGLDRQ